MSASSRRLRTGVALDPESADAVLCFYTRDIMQSDAAIETAAAALRQGDRIAAAGTKRTSGPRALVLNPLTVTYSRTAITNLDGFHTASGIKN